MTKRIHLLIPGNREKTGGFTLIEVIASLILVGILGALGGMAIVQAVNGYMVVRNNAAMTQKAQLAMSRITREIVEMTGLSASATATTLPLENVTQNMTIGLVAGKVRLAPQGTTLANGDILMDNVNAFTLQYYKGTATWTNADDIRELSAIDINLQVTRADGGTLSFLNRVSPRNNKNMGGAAPTAVPPTLPNYGGACFVATAAYGDGTHPAVMLLRDFRDRFLMPWEGGRYFVKQYYIYSPAVAGLIQDRPAAMQAVRCLLFPLALVTFLVVYAPWAGPFLFFLIITGLLFSAGRTGKGPVPLLGRQNGSILIGLVATIVIMGALGAAIVPLFSASSMNQVFADQGRKSYFLAESGFRYASSRFLNAATENDKDVVLTNLNNKTCNLLDNGGAFTTVVYPFWTNSQSLSGTTLTTQINGTIPDELKTGTNGYFRVGTSTSFYTYGARNGSGTTVTFSSVSPATGVDINKDILPVVLPAANTTVTNGGSLTLSGTGTDAFPLLNGNFTLYPTPAGIAGGLVFNYEKRVGNTLFGITLADSTKTWANFTLTNGAITNPATTKITLDKFLQLSSTGQYGGNDREIVYNIPVGWMAGGGEFAKKQYHDRFNDGSNWFTASNETLGSQSVSGGAMNVTATADPTGSAGGIVGLLRSLLGWGSAGNWAFTSFNWGNTETNLAQAWMDSRGCLSYDLQVKLNTRNTAQPNNYFMGGLGFRMRSNSSNQDLYTYGVSVIRGRQAWILGWTDADGIADELTSQLFVGTMEQVWSGIFLYRYSQPAIVFWQRNGPATGTGSFKVLAYRLLTAADEIVTGTAPALRLKSWSSLMVRVIEGYSLTFTAGQVDTGTPARHLKYGDKIRNFDGTKTARVIGTPVVQSGSWAPADPAAGTMILNPITGGNFSSGEDLYIDGGIPTTIYAQAGAQSGTKANYIMVYYSDDKTPAAGNPIQADNIRIGNQRDGEYFLLGKVWPPDDWTDRAAGPPDITPPGNDYFTLVQWFGPGAQMVPALSSGNWTLGSGWNYRSNPTRLQKASVSSAGTAQPNPVLNIVAGTTYDVSITVTNLTAGSFSYTLGGINGGTISSNTTHTNTITAATTGNLIITPTNNSIFRITVVSITPRNNTLDTTADSQGNAASFVPALSTTDFYQAVIKTGALVTGSWSNTSVAADFSGDAIALITSGNSVTASKPFQYDDFGIQMDMKSGSGFLPPIQQ